MTDIRVEGHFLNTEGAAQLVAASPAAAGQQSITKEQALESLSEVGLWLSRDPHALRLRQFIEQLIPVAPVGAPTARMLTEKEWLWLTDKLIVSKVACEAVQRRFCEVNGIALLFPQRSELAIASPTPPTTKGPQ